MNRRQLYIFLALEILAIPWAAALFARLDSKLLAGLLAGSYFVISGFFMLWKAWSWPRRTRSFTWYALLIHVFVVSLPMLLTRLWEYDTPFTEVRILGLPGPQFHNVSTTFFSLLILATLADLARTWLGSRDATPS